MSKYNRVSLISFLEALRALNPELHDKTVETFAENAKALLNQETQPVGEPPRKVIAPRGWDKVSA